MPPKRAFAQEAPEAPQALRRSPRVPTPSKKVRFEEPLTDREIRIIQRGKAQKEFAESTRKRGMRLQDLKRRPQPNEAEVKARQQEEEAVAAREREEVAVEPRRLQEIEDRGGEDNSPVEEEGENGDEEGESSANSDDRAEIDKLTQIRNWPFDIHLTWKAIMDKKVAISKYRGKFTRFNLEEECEDVEASLDSHLAEASIDGEYVTFSRSASIRSRCSRAKRIIETLEDFGTESMAKIEEICLEEWLQYQYAIELTLEIKAKSNPTLPTLKRPLESPSVDSTPSSPQHKRERSTRTTQLRGYQDAKMEAMGHMGDAVKQLVDKWQCTTESCRNVHNWCYLQGQDHYLISTKDMEMWAGMIDNGVALVENPPISLYSRWKAGGPVGKEYKQPLQHQRHEEEKAKKKDWMETMGEIMNMQGTMMQMKMAEQMTNTMDRMNQPPPQPPSQPSLPPPQLPPPPSLPPPPPTPLPLTESSIPRPVTPTRPQPLDRASSPVTITDDEEDAITEFFAWKEGKIKRAEAKERIRETYQIVLREMWSIDDLKKMEDATTVQYKRAIELGIPDGLARQFRRDIRSFKPEWRRGQGLLLLRRGQA